MKANIRSYWMKSILIPSISHLKILGNNVFLPLLQTSMVILPLIFKLCDFSLVIFKQSCRLPLVNAFLPLF